MAGNVGGVTKKTLASAAIFLGVALGNSTSSLISTDSAVVGPYAFMSKEAPTYRTGTIVCLASRAAEIFVILALRWCFVIPNRRRDRKFAEGDLDYDPSVQTFEDKTDWQNGHFRYVA